jgi:hypothetical protein
MNPRYAFAISALFLVIAVVYGLLSHDAAGATMLGALAIGMGMMSFVLLAGSPRGSS